MANLACGASAALARPLQAQDLYFNLAQMSYRAAMEGLAEEFVSTWDAQPAMSTTTPEAPSGRA